MKNNHIFNSFVAGEVSPKFMGRTETQQYNQSCEDIKNMIVYPQGGSARRTGSQYVTRLTNGDETVNTPIQEARSIPFHATDGTKWKIIFFDTTPVTDDGAGWTNDEEQAAHKGWRAVNAETGEMHTLLTYLYYGTMPTYAEIADSQYDLSELDVDINEIQYAQDGDMMVLVHPKFQPLAIRYGAKTGSTMGEKFHAFSWGGASSPVPITAGSDVFRAIPFQDPVIDSHVDGRYLGLKMSVGGTGIITVETIALSTLVPDATWVGRYFKFTRGAAVSVVRAISHTAGVLTCIGIGGTGEGLNTTHDYGASDPDYFYELGAWDDILGWPRTVCFFDSRIVFGGSKGFPDTRWFSSIANIFRLDQRGLVTDADYLDPIDAADPFAATLKDNILNKIQWMQATKNLVNGTAAREWVTSGPDKTKSISIDNVKSDSETPHGSAYIQAVRIENSSAFVQRDRRTIRELVFNFDEDSFQATNLSILCEHIIKKSGIEYYGEYGITSNVKIIGMAMQEVPNGILWVHDSNGKIAAFTRERQQQVIACHRHEVAGDSFLTVGDENVAYKPFVQSLSTISRADNGDESIATPDVLFATVARGMYNPDTEDYELQIFLERFAPEWEEATIESDWYTLDEFPIARTAPIYMDFAYVTDGVWQIDNEIGIIIGLPHSINTSVSLVLNGIYYGEFTVTEDDDGLGKIDFRDKVTSDIDADYVAIIGYNYIGKLVPTCPEVPAQQGSSMGNPRRISEIVAHFHRTCGASYGRAPDTYQANTPISGLDTFIMPRSSDGKAAPMFTGDKKVTFPQGYEIRPRIIIESHLPLPCQVTHIVAKMVVYES
jgi:hypothetical protein